MMVQMKVKYLDYDLDNDLDDSLDDLLESRMGYVMG